MTDDTDGTIELEVEGQVATITLNRPSKANAMTTAMALELHRVCRAVDADDNVRVAVLTGAGTVFSAGSDIATLDEYTSAWHFRRRVDYCDAVLGLRKPIIAMVNGAAVGGGFEMVLSCDIRVASNQARFGAPEVGLGWLGGGGASQLLPRMIGMGNASFLLFTGQYVDAADAYRMGLVQRVVSPENLRAETDKIARLIADNAPIAVQATKAAIRAALSMGLHEGMQYEEELVAVCMSSEDRNEGIDAWRQKRRPNFRGR